MPLPALASFIDLQPLGPTDRGNRAEMAVTITAAPAMERKRRQDLTRRALDHMAQAYGHVHGAAGLS
ncbi:hypothetical protein [Streptomyces sp. NBC_00154]|uniref:hypothetical protein n=1 Tax=Streptomyces sp. NBC_00154 TaxID=2975670 RepID=UPI00224E3AD7|nr:hypothetical protein [Streptomyces sp. NBC_00154]MCX5317759.1 hypothetical protein [Streptomyces sp. NBC_00154]